MKSLYRTAGIVAGLVSLLITSCTNGTHREIPTAITTDTPTPAYTPVQTVVDPALAYGIPCEPACWQGITPGVSTRQETKRVMEQLLASGQADYIVEAPGLFDIYPLPDSAKGSVMVYLEDDIVTEINGSVEFDYLVGTLIERFGNPERLHLVRYGATQCFSCEDWSPSDEIPIVNFGVTLLYPGRGLDFSVLAPFDATGCICPDMKVTGFRYYVPMSIQEWIDDRNQYVERVYPGRSSIAEKDLVEWHGFEGGY